MARNRCPAAKLIPLNTVPTIKRIGIAKGLFEVLEDIDGHNVGEVARLFLGESA